MAERTKTKKPILFTSRANDDEKVQRGTFEGFKSEGDSLRKRKEIKKAIEAYNIALEMKPGDKETLVSRARCYLVEGNATKALADADASLEEDKRFYKGLYEKAEALYFKRQFEQALIYYHRGHKIRPELEQFRLGIQKANEALSNAISKS